MMGILFDMLAMDKWYGVSEEIEIANGKNKIPTTFKEGFETVKRERKWSRK